MGKNTISKQCFFIALLCIMVQFQELTASAQPKRRPTREEQHERRAAEVHARERRTMGRFYNDLATGADMSADTRRSAQTLLQNPEHSHRMLRVAFRARDENMARQLVRNGANINAPDDQGVPLLHQTASIGDTEGARQLLAFGADPLVEDADGNNAIDWAIERGRREILDLMEAQATQDGRDDILDAINARRETAERP